MSKVIDERIVQMSFDNADFQKEAKRTTKTIDNLDKKIDDASSSSGRRYDGLTNAISGVSGRFTALGTVATGALLSIGARAAQLGEQLLRSIAIEPITQGWNEYELKINSIKTMLASGKTKEGLPVTLDMVNGELEDLNKYADQTIYSFADMTANIGKFTNAGVALPDAVQAIKGIANAAALSGANSNEASRAMYNFAQALSAGHVKYIDWMSIQNANMATVDFKEQLLNAAVAAGTLEKTADGMYKVLTTNNAGSTMDLPIDATTNFNDSLQYQWLTTTALTDTLADYADETTEIGKKATEAATKVRTFTQFMDTTKEAVGSGWARTFELIVGDYDEATDLYTALSDSIGSLVELTSKSRNKLVEDIIAQGGRENVISMFSKAWSDLGRVVKVVKIAFKNVFGTIPLADTISNIILNLREFVDSINVSGSNLYKLRTIFEGLFSALALGKNVIVYFIKNPLSHVFKSISSFLPETGSLLDGVTNIATFFKEIKKSTDDSKWFEKSSEKIVESIDAFIVKMKAYGKDFNELGLTKKLKEFFTEIQEIITSFFAPSTKIIGNKTPPVVEAAEQIREGVAPAVVFFEKIKPSLLSIKDWFIPIWDELKNAFTSNWKTTNITELISYLESFVSILFTGGLLAGLLRLINSFTDVSKSASGFLDGITDILDGVKGSLVAYQNSLKAKTLKDIAIAVGVLTASLLVLSLIDGERLKKATLYISIMFAELAASMVLFEKTITGGKIASISAVLVGLAGAILLISTSVAILSVLSPDKVKQGVTAISAIMGLLSLFVASTAKTSGRSVMASAVALGIMAAAVSLMAIPVKIIGGMDTEELKQGLATISLLLAEVVLFSSAVNKGVTGQNLLASAAELLAIAQAMVDMGLVVRSFGEMDTDKLAASTVAIGIILGELVGALKVMSTGSSIKGALSIAAVAGALTLVTPAIVGLGSVPYSVVVAGLLSLAAIFAIIGGAAYLLTPVAPAMLAIAGSVLLFGAALGIVSLGIGAAANGIAKLVGAILAMTRVDKQDIEKISLILGEMAKAIPTILAKFGEGMIDLAAVIRDGAPIIAGAIMEIITQWTILFVEYIPEMVQTLFQFITAFLTEVRTHFPEWVRLGLEMWGELLKGVRQNLPQIQEDTQVIITEFLKGLASGLPMMAEAGADLIIAYLQSISDESPRIVDQAFKTLITFTNGFADAVRENTPALIDAGINMMTSFVDGVMIYLGVTNGESEEGKKIAGSVITGIVAGLNPLLAVAQILKVAKEMVSSIKEYLGINSPSTLMLEIGTWMVEGLINGLTDGETLIPAKWSGMLSTAKEEILGFMDDFVTVGENLTTSIKDGIANKISEVIAKVTELGEDALKTIGWVWDMHSPSRKFIAIGENAGSSIASGLGNTANAVVNSVIDLGKDVIDNASIATDTINKALSLDINDRPIITPVLNLDEAYSGLNKLNRSLSNESGGVYGFNLATQMRGRMQNQNGSAGTQETLTIANTFNVSDIVIREESDINKIAHKLHELQQQAARNRGLKYAYGR